MPSVSTGIRSINGIIAAICKHVIAQQALAGGDIDVRIEEAADCGIIISALQVIQPGISDTELAAMVFYHSQGAVPILLRKKFSIFRIATLPSTTNVQYISWPE